jgi:hypothetical protein
VILVATAEKDAAKKVEWARTSEATIRDLDVRKIYILGNTKSSKTLLHNMQRIQ